MVPALAQVEALIAAVTTHLSPISRGRIAEIEALRGLSGITSDAPYLNPKTVPHSGDHAGE
jgi:hypothetical protein